MDWTRYFETLQDWKRLPAYRAEPRVDSLLGHFLPEILRDLAGLEIRALIPELPLRTASLGTSVDAQQDERSKKVDFLAVGSDRNWLVEFKTDAGSRRKVQDQYLLDASRLGTQGVLEGIMRISRASRSKNKYRHLLAKLQQSGLLDDQGRWTGLNPGLDILYVQPAEPLGPERGIGFGRIADWLERSPDAGEFERAFAGTLREWECNQAES